MCKCDPMKRTPYCGNIGCTWPGSSPLSPKIENEAVEPAPTYFPYGSVFTTPTDNIFDPVDLDNKEVTLKVYADSNYVTLYAISGNKKYFLSQSKIVPGRVSPNVQNN